MWIALLLLAQEPLERYRALEFPPKPENFERGWKERVTAEFDVVRDAKLDALRAGLKDPDPYVRAIAARALGIRGDKASADALHLLFVLQPVCAWTIMIGLLLAMRRHMPHHMPDAAPSL